MSPIEQSTIDSEYLAYFYPKKFKRNSKNIFIKEILCSFLLRTLQYLKKKCPWKHDKTALKSCSKSAQFFFSVLPSGPKSAQISYIFHKYGFLRNFYVMILVTAELLPLYHEKMTPRYFATNLMKRFEVFSKVHIANIKYFCGVE